jgi:hypothetical protein
MSLISDQLLTTVLILKSKDLSNDIDNVILIKLKELVEGRCNRDGYILEDSVRVIQKNIGKCVTNDGQSGIKYKINYKAEIISPSINDELNIHISNINKAGALGYIKIKETDTSENSPLVIMIPKEYFTEESVKQFNDLTIGQKLDIVIIGTRIKYNSKNIQIIAKPL